MYRKKNEDGRVILVPWVYLAHKVFLVCQRKEKWAAKENQVIKD
jgi:hypothetical protein